MNNIDIVAKTNRKVIVASFLLVALAVLGYMLEFIKGSRTLGYVLSLSICIVLPIIISAIFYSIPRFKNQFKYHWQLNYG